MMRSLRSTFIVLVLMLQASGETWAEFPSGEPFAGVQYSQQTRADPPMQLYLVTVDLANSKVHLGVARGGPDPDGAGEWETTLMRPTDIAAREGFDLVVNGDFFAAKNIKDAEGIFSKYRTGQWAAAIGPAVSEGKAWSVSKSKLPCLVVRRPKGGRGQAKVTIEMTGKPASDAWAVVAGKQVLVESGKLVLRTSKERHPRTAIGIDKHGTKLHILVVDGRRPGISNGMTLDELAQEMQRLGCWQAINLDGGGSSVMAMRDPSTGQFKILNSPSDGRERAVANVLGVSVDKPELKKARMKSGSAK